MKSQFIVVVLSLSVLSCHTLTHQIEVPAAVADAVFAGSKASFCDAKPRLVKTTQPIFPLVALAPLERPLTGSALVTLVEEAEEYEVELRRRYKPQQLVVRRAAYRDALVSNGETEKVAGCYAELSPLISNPYRPAESGVFLRIFRGGAVGRSGSVAFWLALNSDGSVARLVPLPVFID